MTKQTNMRQSRTPGDDDEAGRVRTEADGVLNALEGELPSFLRAVINRAIGAAGKIVGGPAPPFDDDGRPAYSETGPSSGEVLIKLFSKTGTLTLDDIDGVDSRCPNT